MLCSTIFHPLLIQGKILLSLSLSLLHRKLSSCTSLSLIYRQLLQTSGDKWLVYLSKNKTVPHVGHFGMREALRKQKRNGTGGRNLKMNMHIRIIRVPPNTLMTYLPHHTQMNHPPMYSSRGRHNSWLRLALSFPPY